MHLMATIGSSGASRRWTRSTFPGLVGGGGVRRGPGSLLTNCRPVDDGRAADSKGRW